MSGIHYPTVGFVLLVFVLATVVARLAHAVIHRVLARLDIVGAENRTAVHDRARKLIRALTFLTYGVAAAASISLALSRLGVAEPGWDLQVFARWFVRHGVNIIIIGVGATIVARAASLAIEHLQFKVGRSHARTDLEWQRRAATVAGILTRLVTVTVGFVAILMLLRELSIDVLPLLTGAGIAGLAIGFGAQNLVRDVISGFFLILEDQVRVGDLATINGVSGTVEKINLRTLQLRDGAGAVQMFPNGTITTLANLSKQFSYAVVEMRVSFAADLERVIDTAREVGAALAQHAAWQELILAPLDIVGVTSQTDLFVIFCVKFKTLPLHQGHVANELRGRLMIAFAAQGIRPYAG
jgi:moderate conductance mechanosensitive channel